MPNHERFTKSKAEQLAENDLESLRERQSEKILESHEKRTKSPETASERKNEVESSRHEALELAKSHESQPETSQKAKSPERSRRPASKRQKSASYKRTMQDVRAELPLHSRAFSKVIHAPVIEKTSEVVGNTIARPNAILSGALAAFILTLGVYLIARYYGYPLSGSESMAAFILGWLIGLVYDYIRLLALGKN